MRDNVTFRSKFPIDLDKHPSGEELALYLAEKLTSDGLKTRVVDNYEFAWEIESESELRMPWALLGYIGDEPEEWLILINSSVSWLGRLVGRSDLNGRRIFTERLQAILSSDTSFSDVRWHVGEYGKLGWFNSPFE